MATDEPNFLNLLLKYVLLALIIILINSSVLGMYSLALIFATIEYLLLKRTMRNMNKNNFEGHVDMTGENIVGTEEVHEDIVFDKEIEMYDWLSDTIGEHLGKEISIEIKIKEIE